MLEGLKILAEDVSLTEMDTYNMQGPYANVVSWLANFIADNLFEDLVQLIFATFPE